MSRYLLLVLLNLPLIIAGFVSVVTRYKLRKYSVWRMIAYLAFWTFVLLGLVFTKSIYDWLFDRSLTDTEPLSLFDVVQITAIISLLYLVSRTVGRLNETEKKLADLHKELSLRLSSTKKRSK